MNDAPQLALFFLSSQPSSTSDDPNSLPSSEPSTSSSARSASTLDDATRSGRTLPVTASSTSVGAGAAASQRPGATSTVGYAQQRMLPIYTGRNTEEKTLTIPRPRTRAECLDEARPCPWVGCRHHLLLEVTRAKLRPPSLRLNMASRDRTKIGRRPALRSSAAAALVNQWIDDAIEQLSRMRFTCALDVVDHYEGEELPDHALALLLGVRRQYINDEVRIAVVHQREELSARGIIDIDEHGRVVGIGDAPADPTFDDEDD